ncbi:hypothetical protein [uncultured Desulfobulbus sp.]|uniref:hypothetical protein n=1 Tax=uncultured Desulfobulbus sp. TaxID=239745 RepID=UPI0029C939CE|nr:hypothetical protein [uncultured Desulfobulbus sp.]
MDDNKKNQERELPLAEPPSSKSSSSTTKIVCLSCLGIMLFIFIAITVVTYPVFFRARGAAKSTSCLSNTKQLAIAFMMYTSEFDDRMPLRNNWQAALDPYIKSRSIWKCPSAQTTDPCYAFNSKLEKAKLSDINTPQDTVMVFESVPGMNQCGGKELFPSPPRHPEGHSIAYADSHAKSVKPQEIDSLVWNIKTLAK